MTRPPADVITATLQRGQAPAPDVLAKQVIAELEGNGYTIKRNPNATRVYCTKHQGTQLEAGRCPTCTAQGD